MTCARVADRPGSKLRCRHAMAVDAPPAEQRRERLREQRRALPDQPGVYLFRDARGRVIYVGKAKSIRKRVASHFSQPDAVRHDGADGGDRPHRVARRRHRGRGAAHRAELHQAVQAALQHPAARRQVVPVHRDQPRRGLPARLLHARAPQARARLLRPVQRRAKRVRGTLDLLGKIFLFRSCEGPEPGRHSGSPCLDYYIKRCGAPCVGYVSKEEYREGIDGVVAFLSGRFKQIERDLERRCTSPPASRTTSRRRSSATGCRPSRRCSSASGWPTSGAGHLRRGRRRRRGHRGQRAGLPGPRRRAQRPPVLLPREPGRAGAGDRRRGVHAPVLRERALDPVADRRPGRAGRGLRARRPRARSWPSGAAARSRSAPPSAAASAGSSTSPSATRGSRSTRRSSRPSAGASSASTRSTGLQQALELDALPVRIECFDISHVGGTHTVASMVVFEGGAPKKSDYRRFTIREVEPGDDFAAMAEVLSRRYAQWEKQAERSPYDAERDASFAALPNLVVIDGGKGQLAAGPGAAAGLPRARRGRRLAGQADRGGLPARRPDADRAAARHARAAAAPARARRGAPLRHHPPPDPPRQGDDRVDHGRPAGHRPGAQARAAQALRLAGGGARRLARGARERARASRRRSRATSTPTSTGRDAERGQRGARRRRRRPRPRLQPRGPRGHLRALRARASRRP